MLSSDALSQSSHLVRFIQPFLVHKIYQLDYNRMTNTYRMLERFLPQEPPDRSSTITRAERAAPPPVGTGAWPPVVGVVRVAWHSGAGLTSAPLLASATASGLCRVDYLEGRWMREKLPYGGVLAMRGEVEGFDMEDDGD